MRDVIAEVTSSGKVGDFIVPKADQQGFYEYILQNVRRSGDGYAFVVPLEDKNLDSVLQQAYFAYKEGKLDKLIQSKAKTESAKRLKMKLKSDKAKASSKEGKRRPAKDKKELGTLDDYTIDN